MLASSKAYKHWLDELESMSLKDGEAYNERLMRFCYRQCSNSSHSPKGMDHVRLMGIHASVR